MKALSQATGTFLSGPAVVAPLPMALAAGSHTGLGLGEAELREMLAEPAKASQRRKLWDLPHHLHCSIIGTCLGLGELRALARRLARHIAEDLSQASDHTLHVTVVRLARHRDVAGKLLHKCLDGRHAVAVRRFAEARDTAALEVLWARAVKEGDVPGAYWAALTHPASDDRLLNRMVGEVHMLSHLVGASNRADLRRLHELEQQSAGLRDQMAAIQDRHRGRLVERDARIQRLEGDLAAAQLRLACRDERPAEPLPDDLPKERQARERAEARLAETEAELAAVLQRLGEVQTEREDLRTQVAALEESLADLMAPETTSDDALADTRSLGGSHVLLVGGRGGQVDSSRSLVERMNGVFLHHDGGVDDNINILPGLVSRADLIVVPMDCVSHEAVRAVRRSAARLGKPWRPLRSASLAALADALHATAMSDSHIEAR
ncbi:MAG TPA: DUF2325 domain-containing protein [Geminicoccaceae bacterium]|nr:DUF2325 domain-containing protein [Geminicoccus sp.]HMU52512.1 DUF2325 domain-containing protein [Geminicoccaceae bacterium]